MDMKLVRNSVLNANLRGIKNRNSSGWHRLKRKCVMSTDTIKLPKVIARFLVIYVQEGSSFLPKFFNVAKVAFSLLFQIQRVC